MLMLPISFLERTLFGREAYQTRFLERIFSALNDYEYP